MHFMSSETKREFEVTGLKKRLDKVEQLLLKHRNKFKLVYDLRSDDLATLTGPTPFHYELSLDKKERAELEKIISHLL
jgi:hypothetical protein